MIRVERVTSNCQTSVDDLVHLLYIQGKEEGKKEQNEGEVKQNLLQSLKYYDYLDPNSNANWFLVAYLESKPTGYISVVRLPKAADIRGGAGGYLYVDELFTSPECRGKGVARALLAYTKDELCCNITKCHGVRLLVRKENHQAQKLYQKFGFEITETLFGQVRNFPN